MSFSSTYDAGSSNAVFSRPVKLRYPTIAGSSNSAVCSNTVIAENAERIPVMETTSTTAETLTRNAPSAVSPTVEDPDTPCSAAPNAASPTKSVMPASREPMDGFSTETRSRAERFDAKGFCMFAIEDRILDGSPMLSMPFSENHASHSDKSTDLSNALTASCVSSFSANRNSGRINAITIMTVRFMKPPPGSALLRFPEA